MTRKALFRSFLCATSICALTLSVTLSATPMAKADTWTGGNINNGMWYQFWSAGTYNGITFNQNNSGNFSVSWNSAASNFTCGTGWSVGDWRQIGYNCGSFSMNGFGHFGVYGWFTRPSGTNYPDTEYYIVEMSGGNPPTGTFYGTVNSDGGTYDIYHNYFPNQTGISGAPLEQWISVRRGNAPTGQNRTVSTWIHFNKWQSLGWRMGNWNYQILGVEGGFGGNGSVNATAWWN